MSSTDDQIASSSDFDAAWSQLEAASPPLAQPAEGAGAETVAESDSSAGSAPEGGVQETSEETPTVSDRDLELIQSEFKRAGLEPDALKGKSGRELELAVANAINTVVRAKDRGFEEWRSKQAQGDSSDSAGVEGAESETGSGQPEALAAQRGTQGTPVDLEALTSTLMDEMGEEAAPVIAAFKGLAEQNAQLAQRLDAQEQERQAAPVNRAIDEALAGNEVLSNPQKREAFLQAAKAKADLDGIAAEPGESPESFVRRVLDNAKPLLGESAPAAVKTRTVSPPSSRSQPSSNKLDEFDRAWMGLGLG